MPHHGRTASARYRAATLAVLCAAALGACDGAPRRSPVESRPPGRELDAATPAPSARSAPSVSPAPVAVAVARVVDGDTLLLAGGQRVRLLGVDSFSRIWLSHET